MRESKDPEVQRGPCLEMKIIAGTVRRRHQERVGLQNNSCPQKEGVRVSGFARARKVALLLTYT